MKNNSPFFSVIIPIYNVEKYLGKCINSVLEQDYKNIEVILVDDGSPDRCPAICDEYKAKDPRVKVIHKSNGGLSSARNTGIRNANGEYLIFLDSDDYWDDKTGLNKIAKQLRTRDNIDVLSFKCIDYFCTTQKRYIDNRQYDCELIRSAPKEEVLKYYFRSGMFPGAAWLVVTRRKLILENQIYFIEGIKAEDIDWLLNVYLKAKKYDAINIDFYVYLKYRTDSITGTADGKSIKDILFTIRKWIQIVQDTNCLYIKNEVLGFLSNHYLCAILIYNNIDNEQKKNYRNALKKYKYLLKYNHSFTALIARMTYNLMGIDFLSELLNWCRKRKKST